MRPPQLAASFIILKPQARCRLSDRENSTRMPCPLWVISGHCDKSAPCPLYPRKRAWSGGHRSQYLPARL
jgi:hypothetical protein